MTLPIQAWLALLSAQQTLLLYTLFRHHRSTVQTPSQSTMQHPKQLLDSSALIDTRLMALVAAGLIREALVPECVGRELQQLADHSDVTRRRTGQQGLARIAELNKKGVTVVHHEQSQSELPVDEQLLKLARRYSAVLITADHALALRAQSVSVVVCDLAALPTQLRRHIVPGDTVTVSVQKNGEKDGQVIGYLPDSTMVVIDASVNLIGQTVEVTVTKVIEKDSGRLVFARVV